jgi:phage recombination protein Bet
MSTNIQPQQLETQSLLDSTLVRTMAADRNLQPNAYLATVRSTCFSGDVTREQFLAFLMVAHEHDLNPITREIYGFMQAGRIQPIVSIDGWLKKINSHPDMDGLETEEIMGEDGKVIAIECKIYRKDRSHPTIVREYMAECARSTVTWKSWPIRMLRHKAIIQCARVAFGFAGIVEADEVERAEEAREANDIEGSATVVVDTDKSASARIADKLKVVSKEEPADMSPVEVEPIHKGGSDADAADAEVTAQIVDAVNAELGAIDEAPDGYTRVPGYERFDEDSYGEITLDDIPGLQKASELKDK